MKQNKANYSKSASNYNQKNTLEALKDPASTLDQKNIFEQLFGGRKEPNDLEEKQKKGQRQEFSLFNYNSYYEKEVVKKQIRKLTEQIKKEIELLKKADNSLISEIQDIEKLTINPFPEKPGIYHIRFLEIVLRLLQSLREKVGESRTWLAAMKSKKKKRGSLFAVLSKKKGTQYSMSQELSNARSVQ